MVSVDDLDHAFESVERYDNTTDVHVVELLKLIVEALKELMDDGRA